MLPGGLDCTRGLYRGHSVLGCTIQTSIGEDMVMLIASRAVVISYSIAQKHAFTSVGLHKQSATRRCQAASDLTNVLLFTGPYVACNDCISGNLYYTCCGLVGLPGVLPVRSSSDCIHGYRPQARYARLDHA